MKLVVIIASSLIILSSVYGDTSLFDVRKQSLSMNSIDLPPQKRVPLDDGLTIYLKKSHDLPLIRLEAHFNLGSSLDPSNKQGLSQLLRAIIFKDLVRNIKNIKEYTGLNHPFPKIRISTTHDITSVIIDGIYDFNAPKSRQLFESTCQRLAQGLFSSDITKKRVAISKKHLLKKLFIWVNNPNLYIKYLSRYHLNDPDFSPKTYIQAVQKITLNDVLKHHKAYIKPNATVLTITGSFNKNHMLSILKKVFSSWKKRKLNYPEQVSKRVRKKVFIIIPRNTVQTYVYLGATTFKCPHSDYPALILANYILGQMVHTNRLYRKIRSELGLVYTIRSRLRMSPFGNGAIEIMFQCDPKKVLTVFKRVNEVLRQFINGPISTDELLQAKLNYIYNDPIYLNSSRRYLASLAKHKLLGFQPNFNHHSIDRLKSISQKDILKVARKYFRPKRFSIILLGKRLNWTSPEAKDVINDRRFIKS